jgi:hypothetical protein
MIDFAQFLSINKHILHQIITNEKRDMNCSFQLANYSFILSKKTKKHEVLNVT